MKCACQSFEVVLPLLKIFNILMEVCAYVSIIENDDSCFVERHFQWAIIIAE